MKGEVALVIVILTLSVLTNSSVGFTVDHMLVRRNARNMMHVESQKYTKSATNSRKLTSLARLRCGGIIIAAGDDDLSKELARIQAIGSKGEVSSSVVVEEQQPPWRTEALYRDWELPLNGERVMFTTPRQYAGKLSSVLVEAGGRPVHLPTVRYLPLPETGLLSSQLDATLLALSAFDVIAFATRYAFHGFWERLTTLHGGDMGAHRHIAEARVKFAGVPALYGLLNERLSAFRDRIIPVDDSANDLSDVLASFGSKTSVLCLAPSFADFSEPKPLQLMLNKLSFRGLDASTGESARYREELQQLRNQEIDVLGLTSALEVQGLHYMLGNTWENLPGGLSVLGNGKETAAAASALGLDVVVLGKKVLSGDALVGAIAHHCSSKRGLQIYLDH